MTERGNPHFTSPARNPRFKIVLLQIAFRQCNGGWQIIDRAVRPDAEVMKAGGDDDLFQLFGIAGMQGEAEMDHAVGVVFVASIVIAELGFPAVQNLFQRWDGYF